MNLIRYNQPNHNTLSFPSFFLSPMDALSRIEPLFDRLTKQKQGCNERGLQCEEHEKEYTLTIELPGFAKNEVSAEIDGGILTVSAIGKGKNPATNKRTIQLPDGIQFERAKANLRNGLLSISLPKKVPKKPLSLKVS